ncbi:amidohydrolase family protein [Acinetobacter sp. MB5]|uniref:amidohydrolase family protein n=1 Tax=Acinetobacter sp. MB5 TaxID=2069438 RepID=UPI000DD0BC1C|nr:amidohydrolase family protein [Acinetobacter sp. MB5]
MQTDVPKIIDSHIHLFDPTRPQGVPWPKQGDPIYRPFLAEHYQAVAEPLGVMAAIAVEASPWLEDNGWLLEQVEQHDFFLGCVGNLDLGSADFVRHFERLACSPKYLGLRSGNLWDYDLTALVKKPHVIEHLKLIAAANKTLDLANPDLQMLNTVVKIKQRIPDLRVVIDHLPNISLQPDEIEKFKQCLKELKLLPNLFVKFSEIAQLSWQHDRFNVQHYQERLDQILNTFGYQAVLFGSDYPNSEYLGEVSSIFQLVQDYLRDKTALEQHHIWFLNALNAYDVAFSS